MLHLSQKTWKLTKDFWNNRLLFEDYPIISIRSVRCKVPVFWYLFMFNISLSGYIMQILWMWVLTSVMLEKMSTQSAQQAWEHVYCFYKCWYELNKMIQTAAVICVIEWWVYMQSEFSWFCFFVVLFTTLWFWHLQSSWSTTKVLSQVINLFFGLLFFCSIMLDRQ